MDQYQAVTVKKVNLAVNAGLNVHTNKAITGISMASGEHGIKGKGCAS